MRKNKKGTIMALLCIVLSVSLITAISALAVSARQMIIDSAVSSYGDWHVKYQNITQEQAEKIKGNKLFSKGEIKPRNIENRVDIEVKFNRTHLSKDFDKEASQIGVEAGVSFGNTSDGESSRMLFNRPLIALESVEGARQLFGGMVIFAGALILIVISWSTSIISNAFYISAAQRIQQFGILKSVGATSNQIRRLVFGEAAIMSTLAVPIGLVCGFLLLALGVSVANNLLRELFYVAQYVSITLANFRVVFSWSMVLAVIIIALITIFISALIPALKVARTPAIDAIRQVKEIKIKPRTLKVSRFINSLFGIEGVMAAKSLKRHKAKYKTTLRALCCGIVTLIVLFGAGGIPSPAGTTVEDLLALENAEHNDLSRIQITFWRHNLELDDELQEMERKLEALPYSSKIKFQKGQFKATATDKNNTISAGKDGLAHVNILALDDEQFDKICLSAGLAPQDFKSTQAPNGILINSGNRYDFGKEWNLSLTQPFAKPKSFTVAAQVKEIPEFFSKNVSSSDVNIFMSAKAFMALTKDADDAEFIPTTIWEFYAQDYLDFEIKAREILDNQTIGSYDVKNPSLYAKVVGNIKKLVRFSVGVFVTMLALVVVANLVNIISTSMALRRREFAMLQSVGMTSGGMNRMLNFEGLFLGCKALMIGVPVGVGGFYWISKRTLNPEIFKISWPHVWGGSCICVVAVMLIIFGTIYYSKRLLKKQNIIEAINNYNT
jgi:putative ABC transport system permease protein